MTADPVVRRPPAVGPALFGVAALASFAAIQRASRPVLTTQDSWWAWDLGRRIMDDGLFSTDPYTFTMGGEPWRFHQWLANLVIGVADAAGGLWLVAVVVAVLAGLAYALLGQVLQRRAPGFAGVVLLGFAVMAAPAHISLRGSLFSLVLTPVLLGLVYLEPSRRRLALLFALFLVWGNLHGGALIGAGLLVVHEVGRVIVDTSPIRVRLAAVGSSILAMCITPYGPMLLIDNVRLAGAARGTGIVEWLPPRLLAPSMLAFTILLVIAIVALATAAGRERVPDALMIAAATVLAMTAIRNVITMAMVIAVAAAPAATEAWDELRERRLRVGDPPRPGPLDRAVAGIVAILGLVVVLVVVPRSDDPAAHAAGAPLDLIAEQAADGLGQRLFSFDSWAMGAAVSGAPRVRTFYDGRVELFGDLLPTYATVIRATPGWDDALDEYCVGDLLIPEDGALYDAVARRDDWKVVGTEEQPSGPAAVWLTRALPAGC